MAEYALSKDDRAALDALAGTPKKWLEIDYPHRFRIGTLELHGFLRCDWGRNGVVVLTPWGKRHVRRTP